MTDSTNVEKKVKQFDVALSKMMADEILVTEFDHILNIPASKIVVSEYDKADWKTIMEQHPSLVILNQQTKDGEFPLYLEITLITGMPPKSSKAEIVDKICRRLDCKALIDYPDNIPSHWVLVHGNSTFQHVSIDPDRTFYANLSFTILAYGDFLDKTELSKMS